jgi:hypothetical protein
MDRRLHLVWFYLLPFRDRYGRHYEHRTGHAFVQQQALKCQITSATGD